MIGFGGLMRQPDPTLSPLTPLTSASAGTERLPPPQVLERSFRSSALGREMPYSVYLPPAYDSAQSTHYPVLYMLHGLGGDHVIEWRAYGIVELTEELLRAGLIEPLIIVLPEGEDGYWMDHADGGPAWGTYVADDLVAEIDSHFRTIPTREARALGGNSMGGHGAMQLAMNYPERFGVVGMHSPTLHGFDTAPAYFGSRDYFETHDPGSLVKRNPAIARALRIWLDVGDRDNWNPIATGFHQELVDLQVPHEFHVFSGVHEDNYWTANLRAYIEFYSRALTH